MARGAPTIDISVFTASSISETSHERLELAKKLIGCLSIDGYVAITGHGLPPGFQQKIFSQSKRFFALPHTEKLEAGSAHSGGDFPRGFTPAGIENAANVLNGKDGKGERGATPSDYKETFDVGSSSMNAGTPNVWPAQSSLTGFQSEMTDAYDRLNNLCQTILNIIMLGMRVTDLERNKMQSLHPGLENQLRLNHYLPFPQKLLDSDEVTRLGAHRDWSSFTLLFQDEYAGLEFEDRSSGQYVLAPPKEGLIYLNIGLMLERFSNGLLPASLHRVITPDALRRTAQESEDVPARFSFPYFFAPVRDKPIEPLETRVREDGKCNYDRITFQEFSEQMFIAARNGKYIT